MFKAYMACGYKAILENGKKTGDYKLIYVHTGIVRDFNGTPGAIIRQYPELAKCDKVVWELHDLT